MKIDSYGRAEILSSHDIERIFGELQTTRDRAIFGICLYTAARINEACSMIHRDVLSKKRVRERILLRSSITKGKKVSREIFVHPQLRIYLEDYVKDGFVLHNSHLFPGRWGRGHLKPDSAAKILRKICRDLEIEGVSTHSFRRTALTRMSDAGIPLRHIMAISGHQSLHALECYLGISEEHKQKAIYTLDF